MIFFAQHVVTIVAVTAVLFLQLATRARRRRDRTGDRLYRVSVQPRLAPGAPRRATVLADVATVAEESIAGVHVVKSFSQERRRSDRFAAAADTVFARTLAANRQRALYVPLLTFLPLVAQALVLLGAGRMVISGSLRRVRSSRSTCSSRCS